MFWSAGAEFFTHASPDRLRRTCRSPRSRRFESAPIFENSDGNGMKLSLVVKA